MKEDKSFAQWVVLELMGHRRLAGYLTEQEIGGAGFLRLEIPDQATQFYSPSAVYCITPTTEVVARTVAKLTEPSPVQQWELTPMPAASAAFDDEYDPDRFRDEDGEDA